MRALGISLLAGTLWIGLGASAWAQSSPPAAGDVDEEKIDLRDELPDDPEAVKPSAAPDPALAPAAGSASGRAAAPPASERWGDGRATRNPRDQPAQGSRYAWKQMLLGVLIMLVMLRVLIWIIRRQTRPTAAPPRR